MRELREVPHNDKSAHVILAKAAEFPSHPVRSGVIRVGDYIQSMAIVDAGDGTTKGISIIKFTSRYA